MYSTPPTTLDLLRQLNNEELAPLVEYITKASTEELTEKENYKNYNPDHKKYIRDIYDEIRLFGGNTFANIFRGTGPDYLEVLQDAAKKIGAKDIADLSVLETEQRMLEVLLRKALKEASGEDREELEEALYQAGLEQKNLKAFIGGAALASLLTAAAYRLMLEQVSLIAANAIAKQFLGHGLRMGAGAAMGRIGGVLLGPIGWVITGIWTAIDIAGPAFRVTIPCTIHIAMLRQKWLCKKESEIMENAFDECD